MQTKSTHLLAVAALSLGLSACGGSGGGSSTYSSAYVQFYNGSSNSATTIMNIDDDEYGSAAFGDATALYSLDNDTYDLEFIYEDSDDEEVTIYQEDNVLKLKNGRKAIIIMSGDYDNPDINFYDFKRKDGDAMDEHFRIFTTSVTDDQASYDFYIAESGDTFEEAHQINTATYGALEEGDYWDKDEDDDSDYFPTGDYKIFLTEPGSTDVVYESQTISFDYETEYSLIIRNTTGALAGNLVVDMLLNSTSVTSYADAEASAQYRIYNSLSDDDLTVALTGSNGEEGDTLTVAAGELSDFTGIHYGDYNINAQNSDSSLSFNNRLLTLNQGESKAVVLYKNGSDKLTSLSFEESSTSQVYDHEVLVANLVTEESSGYDDLDIYFVRGDETTDSAEYEITSLDAEESRSITLPSDYYEIVVVYDDNSDSGNYDVLYRTNSLPFNEEVNYIITIEEDASSSTGYSVKVLSESAE